MPVPQSITKASVTIGCAANASGFSPRGLRLALGTGGDFPLLGSVDRHAVGTWRRFSPIDIPRLAVLSRLLNHGLSVSTATQAISTAIDPRLVGLVLCGIDVPNQLILTRFHGACLHVSLIEEGGSVAAVRPYGAPPSGQHDTTLVIDLEAVASIALSRLPTKRSFALKKEYSL